MLSLTSIFGIRKKSAPTLKNRLCRIEPLESICLLSVTAGLGLTAAYADPIFTEPVAVICPDLGETGTVRLDAPVITTQRASAGKNTQTITWNEVEDACAYRLEYSIDGLKWAAVVTVNRSATLKNLTYGDQMRYRVMAFGEYDGTDSSWSDIKTFWVIPADIDGDGFVGPGDRSFMSSAWFSTPESDSWDASCDVDGDGFVGPGDLSYVSSAWFKTADELAVTNLGLEFDGELVNVVQLDSSLSSAVMPGDQISYKLSKNGTYQSAGVTPVKFATFPVEEFSEPGNYTVWVKIHRDGTLYDWEKSISFTIEEKEVKPEDLALSLAWNTASGGLDLTWTVKNDLKKDALLSVYFAGGTSYSDRLGSAADTLTVKAGTSAGKSGTIHIDGTKLITEIDSRQISHIAVTLGETVMTSIADVNLVIGSSVDTSVINQSTLDAVKSALRAAGIAKANLTSGWRQPADQARAMYGNLATGDVKKSIQTQYNLYGSAGDKVIAVFEAQAKIYNYDLKTIKAHAAEIKQMMTDKIVELTNQGIRVSRHCVTRETYIEHNIVDIGRGPFNSVNIPIFKAALSGKITKLLDEPENGCLHLEF